MSIKLKIKAKHLALEPKVIRHEEEKLKKQIKCNTENKSKLINELNGLVNHRKWEVRNESRATGLARAYLAGKPYIKTEQKRLDEALFRGYIVPRVVSMVNKYRFDAKNMEILRKEVTREQILEWSKID